MKQFLCFLCLALAGCGGHEEPSIAKHDSQSLRQDAPSPNEPQWQWFSNKRRVFDPLLADPREAQVSIGFLRNSHGDSFYDMGFGGDAPILYRQSSDDSELSLTARGLITSRFAFGSESFNLLNTDFVGGAALGHRQNNRSFEVFLYHQSSHLGDETLEQQQRTRIDYSRETLRVLYSINHHSDLRIYGGPSFNIRSDPKDIQGRFTLQAGIEHKLKLHGVPAYVALDLQSKQENDWDINFAAQVGIYLGDQKQGFSRQRLFLELFNGFSSMGQFYDERELLVGFGVRFNF